MLDLAPVARAVVGGSLAVKRGEKVWIHGWDHTTDLMSQLAMECRRVGAEVLLTVEPEELWLHSLLSSPLESLEKLSRYQSSLLEQTDVYIFTLGLRRRRTRVSSHFSPPATSRSRSMRTARMVLLCSTSPSSHPTARRWRGSTRRSTRGASQVTP